MNLPTPEQINKYVQDISTHIKNVQKSILLILNNDYIEISNKNYLLELSIEHDSDLLTHDYIMTLSHLYFIDNCTDTKLMEEISILQNLHRQKNIHHIKDGKLFNDANIVEIVCNEFIKSNNDNQYMEAVLKELILNGNQIELFNKCYEILKNG